MKMTEGVLLGLYWCLVLAMGIPSAIAQDAGAVPEVSEEEMRAQFDARVEALGWQRSGWGNLGDVAEISIPHEFRFSGRDGTQKLMQLFGNRLSQKELGILAPEGLEWFVVFEFDEIGYVKDDEKDEIDAGELLKSFKAGQEADNERRRAAGMEELSVVGWAKEPFYNEQTNNLEWALEVRDSTGNISVNYKTKLLGRSGVMESILVCDGDALDEILPIYQGIIGDFEFSAGNTYAEYREGDKLSSLGLKALMVGGGAFAAAKLGLFGVVFKFLGKIWIVLVAGAVLLKSYISKLFSRGKNQYTVDE